MLSNRGRAANDKERLAGVLPAPALLPREFETHASGFRVIQGKRGGRKREGDRRSLVKGDIIGNLGSQLRRHDGVLLERRVPRAEEALV